MSVWVIERIPSTCIFSRLYPKPVGQGGQKCQFCEAHRVRPRPAKGPPRHNLGLGVFEDLVELDSFELHPREDIITGAVDDAIEVRDTVPDKASRTDLMMGMPPQTLAS